MPEIWKVSTLIASLLPRALGICYSPDGKGTDDVPCHGGTEASFCCGFGWACLSNKICQSTEHLPNWDYISPYNRGSCTDLMWRSGNCPNFCLNASNYDVLDGGQPMAPCPEAPNLFYCEDNNVDLVNRASKAYIAVDTPERPTAITTIGFGPSSLASISKSFTSSSANERSNMAFSPTSSPSLMSSPTSRPTSPPTTTSTSTGTITGAAVGGAVGLAALAVFAVWYFRRKRESPLNAGGPNQEQTATAPFSPPPMASGKQMQKYRSYSHDAVPTELGGQPSASELLVNAPKGT